MQTKTEAVTRAAKQPSRPPRNGRSTPIGVCVPNALLAELRQHAVAQGVSLSSLIVAAIRRGLERAS